MCAMEVQAAKPLRVMTFNVRRAGKETDAVRGWQNRQKLVGQVIVDLHPDVLGLQEPTIEQINDIDKSLGATYKWVGQGRGKEWWGQSEDEYNPLFYNTERVELLDSGTFVINPSGAFYWRFIWSPRSVGLLTRISTWGKFKDKEGGKEFYVYNTHLDNKYIAAQVNGMRNICSQMGQCTIGMPVILMGDFNTPLTKELMDNELKSFKNSMAMAQDRVGPLDTRTGWDHQELKNIDHVLISKNAPISIKQHVVVQEENRDKQPSDHRPVYVDLLFNAK